MAYGSLPPDTNPHLRQMLETMLGRRGEVGDKLITLGELATLLERAGITDKVNLTLPAKGSTHVVDLLKTGQVATGSESESSTTVDAPSTPAGLASNGTLGAVTLTWEAPIYKGHSHTEVWRAQVDDVTQATMVHHEPTARMTDVTGSTLTHYYWIKHVNRDGLTSPFNAVAGVAGAGTMVVTVADLLLEHPEIAEQPFTVINQGTDDAPEWVLALNSDIVVDGRINISQLESGELRHDTALTVGQGSLAIGTNSEGVGTITLTSKGGIQNNDYMVLNSGQIFSYVYVDGVGHVPYKEVKRMESGTANSGQQVTIPAYFRSQPQIHIYPHDVSIYNANYASQSQRLEISHTEPVPHPTTAGAWTFTPSARLLLAAGSETVSPGWTYSGTNDTATWQTDMIRNLEGATVGVRGASVRGLGGIHYQNRQLTVRLYFRNAELPHWQLAAEKTTNVNQDNIIGVTLNADVMVGDYAVMVEFVAADRTGTYTNGNPTYEYTSENRTGSNWSYTRKAQYINSWRSYTKAISINSHTLSGWTITRIDYTATYTAILRVRTLYIDQYGGKSVGTAQVQVPNGSGGVKTLSHSSNPGTVVFGIPWDEKRFENQTVTWTDTSYFDGKMRGNVKVQAKGMGYATTALNSYEHGAEAEFLLTAISATVHYQREQQSGAFTENSFYIDTGTWDKGATDVSISNAVLTWTATSSE